MALSATGEALGFDLLQGPQTRPQGPNPALQHGTRGHLMLTKVSGTVPLPFEETDGLSNPESPDPREAWGHWGMKGGVPTTRNAGSSRGWRPRRGQV